jgi:ATP diphosphatase
MPALCRAQKLQERAAQVGFDWDDIESVFAKIDEEIREIREAISGQEDKAKLTEELGDILFVCVNLARHMQIDTEAALRSANKKFQNRFRYIETKLDEQNKVPENVTLQELDRLWDEAKQQLV